jgi:hypothetical protein
MLNLIAKVKLTLKNKKGQTRQKSGDKDFLEAQISANNKASPANASIFLLPSTTLRMTAKRIYAYVGARKQCSLQF